MEYGYSYLLTQLFRCLSCHGQIKFIKHKNIISFHCIGRKCGKCLGHMKKICETTTKKFNKLSCVFQKFFYGVTLIIYKQNNTLAEHSTIPLKAWSILSS